MFFWYYEVFLWRLCDVFVWCLCGLLSVFLRSFRVLTRRYTQDPMTMSSPEAHVGKRKRQGMATLRERELVKHKEIFYTVGHGNTERES